MGQTPSSNYDTLLFSVNSNLFYCINGGTTDLYTESTFVVLSYLYDILGNKLTLQADQISGGLQIATGSYVGTGTYGESNQNTLTFEFEPKLVIALRNDIGIQTNAGGYLTESFIWISGLTQVDVGILSSNSSNILYISINGNSIEYYSRIASSQLNVSGETYNYFAFG